ncbi:aminomethyltransferase [Streptomyces sp. DvalAA-14]|uniref:aminomethyltransferase family protein n=1 Tax=unclassified Streptomyces TaxID=2593676 RepID=UPI00081BC00B|nr:MULTISPECIES: aminomethyltransferase family protein [unclassified Streptomyces]MYS21712.1 aminomethyl transferase family protein [Streptomyces sp. SID4948]SCD99448.1 aminomethyltransferase [Streptomyces sp. DvalAA-14]
MSRVMIEHLGSIPEMATVSGTEVVWRIGEYEAEYAALRDGVGLVDASGDGPVRISGADAADVLNRTVTRDVEFLVPDRVQTSLVLSEDGRPLDVVTVLAVVDGEYLVHCGPGRSAVVEQALRAVAGAPGETDAVIENLRSTMSVFAVEGPAAWRVVDEVLGEDYVSLAYESLLPAGIGDTEILVARIGVTGEYGYTFFVPNEFAADLWRALAAHSVPVGRRALETAMLEVRQPVLHREVGPEDTVVSAGLNWLVDLSKADFVGRDAVVAQQVSGAVSVPIGFGVDMDTGRVEVGDELFVGSECVGRVGHVVDSPGTGGQLGLAAVPRQWQASRLEFTTGSGALVRTLAAPYVVPTSWSTPIEA